MKVAGTITDHPLLQGLKPTVVSVSTTTYSVINLL